MRTKRASGVGFVIALIAVVGPAAPSAAYERPTAVVQADHVAGQPVPSAEQERGTSSATTTGAVRDVAMSSSGRWVAFDTTYALVPEDLNQMSDVYVADTKTGRIQLASIGIHGTAAIGPVSGSPGGGPRQLSYEPGISGNGRYVSFASTATNLVTGDTNGAQDIFVYDRIRGHVTRVSVDSRGAQSVPLPATHGSYFPSISRDGRSVSFSSSAPDLVKNDTNGTDDVFRHDMRTGRTIRVSVASGGHQSAGDCETLPVEPPVTGVPALCLGEANPMASSLSADGRYVVFNSWAPDLVTGDTNRMDDVFVYDTKRETTTRVSVASDGAQASFPAYDYAFPNLPNSPIAGSAFNWNAGFVPGPHLISDNGRSVVFASDADNLVPNDTNQAPPNLGWDIYVHDMRTGRTERVSVQSDGEEITNPLGTYNSAPDLSGDGRYVAFWPFCTSCNSGSYASGGYGSVYDTRTGQVTDSGGFHHPPRKIEVQTFQGPYDLSADGRYLSSAGQYCYTEANGCPTVSAPHIFRWDFGQVLGVGALTGSGKLALEGDPGFAVTGLAARHDPARDVNSILTPQGANLIGASLAYRPQLGDLLVREELQAMPSVSGTPVVGDPGVLYGFDMTVSGVRYEVRAQRVPGPSYDDAGGASFGLFRLEGGVWKQVATLRGGYGTTGEDVVFAVPLRDIGIHEGGRLGRLRAFTALGTFATGAATVLDTTRVA